jgi:hypothetical protein
MSVEMKWDDPNQLLQNVQQLLAARGTAIRAVPNSAIRKGVIILTGMVKDIAPKKTSTFARSVIGLVKKIGEDLVEGVVGSPMAYARYLEEGTGIYGPKGKPFVVEAKPGGTLFWGKLNGIAGSGRAAYSRLSDRKEVFRTSSTKSGFTTNQSRSEGFIFRKRVTIQGMRARAPFAKAIAAFLPRYLELVEQELARIPA